MDFKVCAKGREIFRARMEFGISYASWCEPTVLGQHFKDRCIILFIVIQALEFLHKFFKALYDNCSFDVEI